MIATLQMLLKMESMDELIQFCMYKKVISLRNWNILLMEIYVLQDI